MPKISNTANDDFVFVSEKVIDTELLSFRYTASNVKLLKSVFSEIGFKIITVLTEIVAIKIIMKFFGAINYENSFLIEFRNFDETRTRSMVCSKVISVPRNGFVLKNFRISFSCFASTT